MDSYFSPHSSPCSRTICLWGSGNGQIKLLRISLTCSLSKANACCSFTVTVKHNNRFAWSVMDWVWLQSPSLKNTLHHQLLSKLKKKTAQELSQWCHVMLFCLGARCIWTRTVYWKGQSPSAVVSLGAYLSHGWYDALWMRRVHVIRAAASAPRDKVTRGVKAAYKQACPLPDRKLGAAEALPCLICQQRSLPRHSSHVWWCAQLRAGRLFWFQPVWHICCLSRCVVPVCRAERDRGKCGSHPSVRVYKQGSRLQTGRHGPHHAKGQEALWDTTCTCAAGVTSHQSWRKCVACRLRSVSALY